MKPGMKYAIMHYGVGNLFARSIGFILLPVYAKYISPAEFGDYSLLMAVFAIAQVLFQFAMQNAVNKFLIDASNAQEQKTVYSTIFWGSTFFTVILTALFLLNSAEIARMVFQNLDYTSLVALCALVLATDTIAALFIYLFVAQEKSAFSVKVSVAAAAINIIGNLLFIIVFRQGIWGIFSAQLFANICTMLLAGLAADKHIAFKFNVQLFRSILRYCFPLFVANVFTAGTNIIDRFLLNSFAGNHEVGLYSFSYRIAMIMNVFIIAFGNAWNPRGLQNLKSESALQTFGDTFLKLIGFGMLLAVCTIFFTNAAYQIPIADGTLLNNVYKSGSIILLPVLAAYLIKGVGMFYSIIPLNNGKTYHILISDGLAFAVNILSNIVLIPQFGMMGAALATLLAFCTSTLYLYWYAGKTLLFSYPKQQLVIILLPAILLLYILVSADSMLLSGILILLYVLCLFKFTKLGSIINKV